MGLPRQSKRHSSVRRSQHIENAEFGSLAEDVKHEDGMVRAQRPAGLADDHGRRVDAPLDAHILCQV